MWTMILNGLGWVLLQLYQITANYGFAIILFSIISKVVLLPFSMKSKKSQMRMTALTPKQKAIEAKYKDDKDRSNLEIQKMYKEEKVNPLGGCLWQLLPWPIFIALLAVMRLPLTHMMLLSETEIGSIVSLSLIKDIDLVSAMQNQLPLMAQIHANFDAIVAALPELSGRLVDINFLMGPGTGYFAMDLSAVPSYTMFNLMWFMPVLSAGVSYLQTIVMQKLSGTNQQAQQQGTMKMLTYMGPVMSLIIGFQWPVAMSIYWTINGGLGILQDWWLTVHYRKVLNIPSPAEQKAQEEAAKEEQAQRDAERQARLEQLASGEGVKRTNISSKKYKQLKAQQHQRKIDAPVVSNVSEDEDVSDDDTDNAAAGYEDEGEE